MTTRTQHHIREHKKGDVNIDTLIERLKKIRALNCDPHDVGMDEYVWKRFNITTKSHLMARMF